MNFPKNYPFEDCKFWHFSGLAQFSVLTYFHYFGFFGIILSRSMGENSVILKICPFGYTLLSKSCICSFCVTIAAPRTIFYYTYYITDMENWTFSGHLIENSHRKTWVLHPLKAYIEDLFPDQLNHSLRFSKQL